MHTPQQIVSGLAFNIFEITSLACSSSVNMSTSSGYVMSNMVINQ